ncbi:MAG: hypothetical protein AAF518_25195 [Spirochaetota bacterium]
MQTVPFALFFLMQLINCQMETRKAPTYTISPSKKFIIFVDTGGNPILKKLLCQEMQKNGFPNTCYSKTYQEQQKYREQGKELILAEPEKEVFSLSVQPRISKSSYDLLRNVGMSLLTLTSGTFVSTSAEIEYTISLRKENTPLVSTKLQETGRIGFYSFLPFYMGFAATGMGTALNTYRNPENLQKYCLHEKPNQMREFWEQTQEEYCREYEVVLKDSFYGIESKIFELIRLQLVAGHYYE